MQEPLTNQITFRGDLTTHSPLDSLMPLGALHPPQLLQKEAGSLHPVSCCSSKRYLLATAAAQARKPVPQP